MSYGARTPCAFGSNGEPMRAQKPHLEAQSECLRRRAFREIHRIKFRTVGRAGGLRLGVGVGACTVKLRCLRRSRPSHRSHRSHQVRSMGVSATREGLRSEISATPLQPWAQTSKLGLNVGKPQARSRRDSLGKGSSCEARGKLRSVGIPVGIPLVLELSATTVVNCALRLLSASASTVCATYSQQLGQIPRSLHAYATSMLWPPDSQRHRANPCAKTPHLRKERKSFST